MARKIDTITLMMEMLKLGLNPADFSIANPATVTLVRAMKLLNNPETDSKVILNTFTDFRVGGKYSPLVQQSTELVETVEYWYNIYVKLLESKTTAEVKTAMASLFDKVQDKHNQSKYNLGQSFMKATMHLVWKKLTVFNPDLVTDEELEEFESDTPADIAKGQIIFRKIFAVEMRNWDT
jgi:hypothetical protein